MTEQLSAPCFAHHDFNISIESKQVLEKLAAKLTAEYKFTFPLFELGGFVYAKKTGDKSNGPGATQIIEKSGFLKTAHRKAPEHCCTPGQSMSFHILKPVKAFTEKHFPLQKGLWSCILPCLARKMRTQSVQYIILPRSARNREIISKHVC